MKTLIQQKRSNNKSISAPAHLSSKQNRGGLASFQDNRPESAAQFRMQAIIQEKIQFITLNSQKNSNDTKNIKSPREKGNLLQLKEEHKVSKAKTPNIYELTVQAIGKGAPDTLTYFSNKPSKVYVQHYLTKTIVHVNSVPENKKGEYIPATIHEVNRAKALGLGAQLNVFSKNYKHGLSRDEYPYASTMEGGTDSYWAYVPEKEQSIQGGQLSGLYKKLESGEEFDVKTVD